MNIETIKDLITKAKVPFTDDSFYPRIFSLILKQRKILKNDFKEICEEEYGDISRRADVSRVQESVSIRNVLRTRRLSQFLVNEKGEISADNLDQYLQCLEQSLYSIGPNRQYDSTRQELILKSLKNLQNNKELLTLLKNINKPYSSREADEIIKSTLGLDQNQIVTDVHAKMAVIAALICYLRQSVGSCFGTAPCILIHDEQPIQFVKDIVELFGTGRLKRTFGGIEYSVPLSTTWGVGDLKKPILVVENSTESEIYYCPGLINAMDAVSIFSDDFKLKNKVEMAKKLVGIAIRKLQGKNSYLITNMEELIRSILLDHFQLNEEAISNYLIQEKVANKGSLFVPVSSKISAPSKNAGSPSKFLAQFEIAKTAFKILVDNALLKSWEFTVASFSENKAGFTTWNLYASLGFKPNEKGGIGESLYEILKIKLDESNRKVEGFQEEYDQAYSQLKYYETRIRTATTEKEIGWLKVEYQSKVNEFHFLEEMRNKLHSKAKRLANLFDQLIDIFMELFPQYFQEVYDASMHDVAANQYDDSPAGFRLVVKHGRGNTAQWTQIYTADEFIDALIGFFTATESEIRHSAEMEGLEEEFTEMITAVVLKIRSPEFLDSAFSRMAAAHHIAPIPDPLNNLDKIEKKPWAYVSGGSMVTLISTYYKSEEKPHEVARWVESPTELLVFLIDTMKLLPPKLKEEYVKNPNKSMLIHSPTHAFSLKPGFSQFMRAWTSEIFTYTYVRDKVILPTERFIRGLILDEEMMDYFIHELIENFPVNFKSHIKGSLKPIYKTLTPPEFRNHLVDQLRRDRSLNYLGRPLFTKEDVDSRLYSSLPLFHTSQLKELVKNIFNELSKTTKLNLVEFEEILDSIYDTVKDVKIISSTRLQDVCKVMICLMEFKTSFSIDYHATIAKACQNLGYAMPESLIVADSNWVKDYFGFVVNPGTLDLEFWRLDPTGTVGSEMSSWNMWLNGTRQDLTWGVLNQPHEYTL